MMQFLDTKSKLKAARCSRQLLQAADHPFAWQGPPVAVSSYENPDVGSRIHQSLLRNAPITLRLGSDLPTAEVAIITRLRELVIDYQGSIDFDPQLFALPSLQGLQTLRVLNSLPESALRLLPTLPALHTLCWFDPDALPDWSWLQAMRALTDLDLRRRDKGVIFAVAARRHRPMRPTAVAAAATPTLQRRRLHAPLPHSRSAPAAPPHTGWFDRRLHSQRGIHR